MEMYLDYRISFTRLANIRCIQTMILTGFILVALIIISRMLDFKKIITVFFVCNILLCSCAEQRFAFDKNKNVDTILFKDIPAIAQKIYPDHTVTAIDSVC